MKNAKRMQPERPGPPRRRGGQPGNRNAAKPLTPLSAIRARIRKLGRRLRAVTAGGAAG